jgi:hypothetical protein
MILGDKRNGPWTFYCHGSSADKFEKERATRRHAAALIGTLASGLAAVHPQYSLSARHTLRPIHTSALMVMLAQGAPGQPDRFCNRMGMSKHVFQQLLCELVQEGSGLRNTKHVTVTVEELLALSLHNWFYELTPTGEIPEESRRHFN